MDITIDENYFFYDESRFPWNVMELSRPSYGPVHSYLASILWKFAKKADERQFLRSGPTMRELLRFSKLNEDANVSMYIIRYVDGIGDEKMSAAYLTLRGLYGFKPYVQSVKIRLEQLYRRGQISVPALAIIRLEQGLPSW